MAGQKAEAKRILKTIRSAGPNFAEAQRLPAALSQGTEVTSRRATARPALQ